MRVLLGYEFGRGSGHVVLLTQLAHHLQLLKPGIKVRIIMPVGRATTGVQFAGAEISLPLALKGTNAPNTLYPTLGENLCHMLFVAEDGLEARLSMWRNEIESYQPDLVIADFAPCLSMAARGLAPCLVVGTGYTIPPAGQSKFEEILDLGKESKRLPEKDSLQRLNSALKNCGCKQIEHLPQMVEGDAHALMTIPLFDPYWRTRNQPYCGVIHPGGSPKPVDEAEGCLAYFSYEANVAELAEGLKASGMVTTAVVGNMTEAECAAHSNELVTFTTSRFQFAKAMPGKAIILHGGTLGVASAALYAGVPQVSLYSHDETWHTSNAVSISQTGLVHPRKSADAQKIADLIKQAKDAENMRGFARDLSKRYSLFRDGNPIALASEIALGLV